MSVSTLVQVDNDRTVSVWTRLGDYIELTKPRILIMVLVTLSLTGVIATWGQPNLRLLLHTLIGTTFVAGSASIFNQWIERRLDAKMRRTENRPLPTGRLSSWESWSIGVGGVLFGLGYLLNTAGRASAFWAAATWLLYVVVYTPLKTRTWLNTLVGAIPGALPVLVGWTGVGAELDLRAMCLFMLVFLWQFPHFMAIAWLYRHQYTQANMQMLTVVDPSGCRAGRQAVAAAGSVWIVSLAPAALVPSVSIAYLFFSCCLGAGQLACAWRFACQRDDFQARRLLRASLVYLPLQFILVTLLNLSVI